jgi:hypothetical protein
MEYLIPAVILLLLVGGFITFMVMNATKRSDHATAKDSGDAAPGIGSDESPLGDTQQHAGQQDARGHTTGGQDADDAGGAGEPALGAEATDRSEANDTPAADGRFQRDPIGGEAEARPYQDTER